MEKQHDLSINKSLNEGINNQPSGDNTIQVSLYQIEQPDLTKNLPVEYGGLIDELMRLRIQTIRKTVDVEQIITLIIVFSLTCGFILVVIGDTLRGNLNLAQYLTLIVTFFGGAVWGKQSTKRRKGGN